MKKFFLTFLCATAAAWTNAAESVTVGQAQFTASGDIDGDGDFDAIIIDRLTGVVTIGVRQPNGTLAFRQPVASGVPNPTSVAVGRFCDAGRDSIALTSPLSNRVQLLDPQTTTLQPITASFPQAGPRLLAPFDISGVGTAGLEDLALASGFEGRLPLAIRRLPNNGDGTFGNSAPGFINADLVGWTPVTTARAGGTPHIAFIEQDASLPVFRLATPTSASFSYPVNLNGFGSFSGFVFGQFDVNESDFFFYNFASPNVECRRLQPGGATFYGPTQQVLPMSVSQLIRLRRPVADRVLAVGLLGEAVVFDYTGAGGFVEVETLDLGDDVATGALALGDGSVVLLSSSDPYQSPSRFSVFAEDGMGGYVPLQFGVPLPPLNEASSAAGNLFFFAGRPLIDEDPPLVGVWSVADWSSNLTLGGVNKVFGETFLGAAAGLSNAAESSVAPVPLGTIGGLPNQHQADISFANLNRSPAVLGDVSAGLVFTPEAGRHGQAVQIAITSSDPAAAIFFRTSPSASFVTHGLPFWLFTDTTVEAYALLTGGERTPYSPEASVRP